MIAVGTCYTWLLLHKPQVNMLLVDSRRCNSDGRQCGIGHLSLLISPLRCNSDGRDVFDDEYLDSGGNTRSLIRLGQHATAFYPC